MNILLTAINAKYIHSNLAVYSLKASAGKYEPLIELTEFTINNQTDDIFRAVYQKKPELLFLSCYIWNRSVVTELAENIHKVLPETVIWAGGPEVSYDAERFLLEQPQFSGIMKGEGERTFFRLLEYYIDGKGALSEIPGITYREDGGLRSTGMPEMMKTLDELPFVYQIPEKFEHRIIYYESSRGCPYSCSYCLSSIDKRVRFRSPELVKKELGFLLEHRVPQVKFVDRTFNCNHRHALEIWKFIREHDNGITNFHFEIAADILTEEELEVLAGMRPGLVQLEIGVQTVNERTLEAIHRTAKFERIAERVQRIAAGRNIHQHLDLIAGLPYEDFESFRTSFDRVYGLKPQELQLGFLKVLQGSEMYQRAGEYGILYRSAQPYEVLATRWISCGELMRLKEVEEMLEVYYNSQQFRYTIEALERWFDRPIAMYEALADYYRADDAEGKSYSRMQRFAMLRGFIRETVQERKMPEDTGKIRSAEEKPENTAKYLQYFDELLTLDIYLRENAKSRPVWAEDAGAYRDRVIQFYQQEEQTHRYLPAYGQMNWKQMMRMTHLEHFTCGVAGKGAGKEVWLLFDYEKRDPLTKDAAVCEVEMPGYGAAVCEREMPGYDAAVCEVEMPGFGAACEAE
ncbi:MAG: B12-binding domain-containing radical SAM protein [Lachnospiraceae bacterium]|nr:B12-binding domain-containing radical SAM protein [Lachnospiraceae bacterium]